MSDFRRVADAIIDFDRVKMIEPDTEGLRILFEDGTALIKCNAQEIIDNLCAKPPVRHIPSLDRR